MHVKRPSTGFERGRLTFALKNITFADSFTPGEHTCAQQNVTAYGNDMPVRSPYMKLGVIPGYRDCGSKDTNNHPGSRLLEKGESAVPILLLLAQVPYK